MATVRRLYLYIVTAIGLGLLLQGGATMLRILLEAAGVPHGAISVYEIPSPTADKEALSLAVAFVIVGLPVWLIHWGFIERLACRGDAAGAEERGSIIRSIFFLLALAWLLYMAAGSLFTGLREWLSGPLGTRDPYYGSYWIVSVAANLSTAILFGLAWAYHANVRARDLRLGPPLVNGAARAFRLYLYGAALIALAVIVQSLAGLGGTIVDAIRGYHPAAVPVDGYSPFVLPTITAAWWMWPLLSTFLTLLIAVPIWLGHFVYSNRLLRVADLGPSEATSRMRLAYFAAAVLIGVATLVSLLGDALGPFFAQPLKAIDPNSQPAWRNLAVAALVALVPAALAVSHRRRAVAEAVGGDASGPGPARVVDYGIALVGLAALSGGLVTGLAAVFQNVNHPGSSPADLYGPVVATYPWTIALGFAQATAGFAVWLWAWATISRRYFRNPFLEAGAPSRRFFLLLVIGVSLVGGAFGLAACIERLTRVVVGVNGGALDSIPNAVAAVLVAAPLLIFHLTVLRLDSKAVPVAGEAAAVELPIAEAAATEPGTVEPAVAVAAEPTEAGAPELVIVGPAGADLDGLRNALGSWLPPGFTAEVRR
jgi:hypothetical protein